MTNRSPDEGAHTSELSFEDSPGSSLFFNPNLDISLWSKSVSGASISGKDLFLSQLDCPDMTGHLEPFLQKDDNVSVVSSMGDSAYQSQPDAARRGAGAIEGHRTRSPHDTRSQMSDQFLGQDLYSPPLSSDNYSAFPAPQADMNQMFLAPSAGDSNVGEGAFFTNYPQQSYNQFQGSAISPFTPTSEIDVNQSWQTAEAHTYSGFTPIRQGSQQRFYSPFVFNTNDTFNTGIPNQHRAHRPQLNTETARSSSPLSARRTSNTEQMFRAFVASPTSTVMSMSQQVGFADDEFRNQHNFVESAKIEKQEPLSASVDDPSIKDDEFEEEILSPEQAAAAQSLEDTEGKLARTHPLYQAQPGDDDLYHCPNEGQPGCNHKPTKLKCNYDKYVDSHLRPFRCKVKACVGVQFSSTACLLRHEREAHGMHGHGSKPHLCTYPDCERSVPGNGFPRRYNLFDHMKRVHDYTGNASPTERTATPTQGTNPAPKRQTNRKRKQSGPTEESTEKRTKTSAAKNSQSAAAAAQHQLIQQKQTLQKDFQRCKEGVLQALNNLQDPKDLNGLQLSEDIITLQKISSQLKGLG